MSRPRKTPSSPPVPTLLLRPADAAIALGVSRRTVYDLIARKDIPSVHIGRDLRVPLDALRAWVQRKLAEQERAV